MQEAKTKIYSIYKANSLIGMNVRNVAGERLGTIKDLMIDVPEGRIAYAVLSSDSFLGLDDKLFAVPWKALMLKPQEKIFIFDVDKDTLKGAPGFDKNNWPDSANPKWDTGIRDYWESRESRTENRKPNETKKGESDADLLKTPLA